MSPEERLRRIYARCERRGDCLIYTGPPGSKGYGVITYLHKNWSASKLVWFLRRGPIAPGALICHTCDTPLCVELEHLFKGTHLSNAQDKVAKGRSLRGERNAHATLSDAKVRWIRRMLATGEWSQTDLAFLIGVTQSQIWHVAVRRCCWAHVA